MTCYQLLATADYLSTPLMLHRNLNQKAMPVPEVVCVPQTQIVEITIKQYQHY
jgi:hypothetical protein